MKATDLMIGDWVRLIKSSIPFLVDTIYDGEVNLVTHKGCDSLTFLDTALEPIPLTPEILEKNGFRYGITETEEFQLRNAGVPCCCQKGYVYEDISGTIKIIFPKETDSGQIEIYDTKFDRSFCFVWSKDLAVHELQHALRLCGIEKEVVL